MTNFLKTHTGLRINVDKIITVYPRVENNKWMSVAIMQNQDGEEYTVLKSGLHTRQEAVEWFDNLGYEFTK